LPYSRRTIVALSFLILSLGSAIYLSIATWNYLLLYPALGNIENDQSYQVDKLMLNQPVNNVSTLGVQISVRNPSQYSGFRVYSIQLTIPFYDQSTNSSVFPPLSSVPGVDEITQTPLGPGATDTFIITIRLSSDQTSELFLDSSNSLIIGNVFLRIDIGTFLDSVFGTQTYTRTQPISLTVA